MLVGNKIDLEENRSVNSEQAKFFALENNMEYQETSAYEGVNIKEVFDSILNQVLLNIK